MVFAASRKPQEDTRAILVSATQGFDELFMNRIDQARTQFATDSSPFHALGLGVCAFLEAALGMEMGLMGEAARCLNESEAGSRKQLKAARSSANGDGGRFPPGIEYEVLQADAIVLQGLVYALSESYMGYLQCLYALNNAHSKFTKLFETVFPTGLDAYITPAASPLPSRNPSTPSLASTRSTDTISVKSSSRSGSSFFGRWGSGNSNNGTTSSLSRPALQPEGPVEELIVSGAAFGFGLFNLVFSLLPAKVKTIVGFFGFQHNRRLALQALAVSAARKDVHSVFAGLALMTYYGVVLLLTGYQADEDHTIRRYKAIVDSVSERYPDGALWILNRAKILRMTYDPEGAIKVLRSGLRPDRPGHFQQADALLVFELAWTLLSQRRYQEAADMFIHLTEINSWSHATYYAIAGGCYVSLGQLQKAKELLDQLPTLLETRKIGGKDLPTEVLIKKKIAFYKAKAKRRGGDESSYVEYMKLSIAEELSIFWNTHQRTTKEVALEHVKALAALTPPVTIKSPFIPSLPTGSSSSLSSASFSSSECSLSDSGREPNSTELDDLDTHDEYAVRSLILGIVHRTLGEYVCAREFLCDAHKLHDVVTANWVGGLALFELAVLDLKEMEARDQAAADIDSVLAESLVIDDSKSSVSGMSGVSSTSSAISKSKKPSADEWASTLNNASEKLDKAMAISGNSVDLSSRLDSRANMLRDEIALKREMLGLC